MRFFNKFLLHIEFKYRTDNTQGLIQPSVCKFVKMLCMKNKNKF